MRKIRPSRTHHTPEFRDEALKAVESQPERTIGDIVRVTAIVNAKIGTA